MQTLTKTIEWWWFDGDLWLSKELSTVGMVDKKKSQALPQTNRQKAPHKMAGPQKEIHGSSSNHPFSGANC